MSIRQQIPQDDSAIDALMAEAFGPSRHARTVWHLRQGDAVPELCFVQEDAGAIIGSLRFWPILLGGKSALLLGPLAIAKDYKGKGFGKALVAHAIARASQMAYHSILVSGEPDYYPQFGFISASTSEFLWPGFIEEERLQILWLAEDAAPLMPGVKAILPTGA